MNMESLSKLSGLSGRWQKLTKALVTLTAGLALAATAHASHFRGANLTWKRIGTSNTVQLTVTEAWRINADDTLAYQWGDGSAIAFGPTTKIATDPAFDVLRKVATHTYTSEGPFTITGTSC